MSVDSDRGGSPLEGGKALGLSASLWGEQVISYVGSASVANPARSPGVSCAGCPERRGFDQGLRPSPGVRFVCGVASLHGATTGMTPGASTGREMLEQVWSCLAAEPTRVQVVQEPPPEVPLSAHLDVASLAWASVAAASLSAAELVGGREITPDADRIAVAYASERHLRVGGEAPTVWAPLSGFFRSSDGWVRTHGNYPHHAAALRRGLGLPADAGKHEVAASLRGLPAAVAAEAVTGAGGLCVPVAHENAPVDAELRDTPIIDVARAGDALPHRRAGGPPEAPLRGIRVLDLTRVIAGPVATRTLALLGADVLRIDPPRLPEPEWQHFDTGHGKRSTILDLGASADRERFERLLATADVVVTGYRARALERLGLAPASLIARHPSLVAARLTAWGADDSAADRRGFDSLVQAASGIAWIESDDGESPGALPVQALDHSAGYLLAAGILRALARRNVEGAGWIVETSLRRIAAELLGMPRTRDPQPADRSFDPARHVQEFDVGGLGVITAAPALAYDGGPTGFSPPRRWGRDAAEWR